RVVGQVERATAADAIAAVDVALLAHASGALPQHQRAEILERASQLIGERAEALARSISDEAGKPITAARVEVQRAADTLRWSGLEARRLAGEVVPVAGAATGAGYHAYTIKRPVGVVVAISPFNFPLNLCCHKLGPAIAAGCPVVHKPASFTPLTALMLRDLLYDAGLPKQWLSVVCGPGGEAGDALVSDRRIAAVSFTGSSAVGWKLHEKAAPHVRIGLELGNSTPVLVFADADLEAATSAIVKGGFGYAGQSCVSIQRVLAHDDIHDDLLARVTARVSELVAGDPAAEDTVVGPVIDDDARDRIIETIAAAAREGATTTTGGKVVSGNVVQPTVLADVTPDMQAFAHEIFGPVVTFTKFASDAEAVELANATDYGLQAGVFSASVDRAFQLPGLLHFGGVIINDMPTFRADVMPYGGVKDSGNTREGPRWAIENMVVTQLVVMANVTNQAT
ncbi:MAG: aldehyde dehydrogenase family protein, partial [Thermoleophilia bacterium]|nr:aldehyde dehydrogenase family protein [Thermoleophilia bacterium]